MDKLTGGSGGVGGSRGFGVGGSSGLGGSNSFDVGIRGSSGGGAARILNAAGGYNRAPRPVYPASKSSLNTGSAIVIFICEVSVQQISSLDVFPMLLK